MDGEQFFEVIQRVKAMGEIEVLLVLPVSAFHRFVVARCVRTDEFLADT